MLVTNVIKYKERRVLVSAEITQDADILQFNATYFPLLDENNEMFRVDPDEPIASDSNNMRSKIFQKQFHEFLEQAYKNEVARMS